MLHYKQTNKQTKTKANRQISEDETRKYFLG